MLVTDVEEAKRIVREKYSVFMIVRPVGKRGPWTMTAGIHGLGTIGFGKTKKAAYIDAANRIVDQQ